MYLRSPPRNVIAIHRPAHGPEVTMAIPMPRLSPDAAVVFITWWTRVSPAVERGPASSA